MGTRTNEHRAPMVTFRLSAEELRKLDVLAEATLRDRSKVLRALLRAARLGEPDLRVEAEEVKNDRAGC